VQSALGRRTVPLSLDAALGSQKMGVSPKMAIFTKKNRCFWTTKLMISPAKMMKNRDFTLRKIVI